MLPKAEIISRPRFSTLSYAGAAKLSRLPPRSAIVAFSADQVYAVAEALRRLRGGAAVVMGALSPAHPQRPGRRCIQAGEVDYLVATDAIGMGLNMDVAHVAFAGLSKFDGKRRRRLTPAEMAQIAGRAGRHQRDGTFGTLNIEGEALAEFREDEIDAIENHRFAPLDFLYWREGDPDYRSVEALIRSLERRPDRPGLRAAPEAVDLAVLKALAERPDGRRPVRGERGGAAAMGRLRPARFPQDRARPAWPAGRAPVRVPQRRATAASRRAGMPSSSPGSTMSRATSTRSPTASPACGPGPISPTATTGCTSPPRWPSAPARSRRNCRMRFTSG